MSDSESDIEMRSALPKKIVPMKPAPRSPSDDLKSKKITTKIMITDALTELKTRKGVSLYAIKKFLTEKYNVDTEKINYLIKKSIKAGVEDGTFIQMKGIGASGSFKLANVKEKPKTKKKPQNVEKTEKKMDKSKEVKKPKKMEIKKKVTEEKKNKKTTITEEPETKKKEIEVKAKKAKVKLSKVMKSPTKKPAALMKRKSIGSIIKNPKMKPKSHA